MSGAASILPARVSGRAAALAPACALLAAGMGILFAGDISAAIQVWRQSTAYGHCFLVLPIAAWLAWERRDQAAPLGCVPVMWPALCVLPLSAIWLAAALLGIEEARQFAALGMLECGFLAALGPRLFRALSAPLLYLVFLVPFGAFLTPVLQDYTAWFIARGLDLLGIAARVTSRSIEIPEGNFYVAEACAGLRFLIASAAFGTLYALTMFRSPGRRIAFIAIACIVPILANGVRGLGIVLLGHVLGSAEAAAADHVIYGWVFFSAVIIVLALAGMPFRQDVPVTPSPALPVSRATARHAVAAVTAVLAASASGPGLAALLHSGEAAGTQAIAVLITPPGCATTRIEHAGPVLRQFFVCGQAVLQAETRLLPRRGNPAGIVRAGGLWAAGLIDGPDMDNRTLPVPGGPPWAILTDEDQPRAAATASWADGRRVNGGIADRLRLAEDAVFGRERWQPVMIGVAMTGGTGQAEAVLRDFLAAQGDLEARVAVLAQR